MDQDIIQLFLLRLNRVIRFSKEIKLVVQIHQLCRKLEACDFSLLRDTLRYFAWRGS